jgi:uracil-DNA glycosylase family 4
MKPKQSRYDDLINRVQGCNLCPRMRQRKPVLSCSNGNLDSPVVFVAEAPGRFGADKYGIPLFGDQTGRNFDSLLSCASISRDSIFITNAVLCNPRKLNGNNDSPNKSEINNCLKYLEETLDIIRPEFVAPLGKVALTALKMIHPFEIELRESVGRLFPWNGCQIYPLFHPSPRAFIWRGKTEQCKDYISLAKLFI